MRIGIGTAVLLYRTSTQVACILATRVAAPTARPLQLGAEGAN